MKVLVACEFSGIVREAFARHGHDAWSCDQLPSEIPGKHLQMDVFAAIAKGWDMMIAHPPCTYLSAAGLHLCKGNPERVGKQTNAVKFVHSLYDAPVKMIAIENPVGWLSTAWRKPDQIVRMNDFGHAEAVKPTCFWLKNLPPLMPTIQVPHRKGKGKRVSEWFGKTRDPHKRSITFQGLADAMAEQWGNL